MDNYQNEHRANFSECVEILDVYKRIATQWYNSKNLSSQDSLYDYNSKNRSGLDILYEHNSKNISSLEIKKQHNCTERNTIIFKESCIFCGKRDTTTYNLNSYYHPICGNCPNTWMKLNAIQVKRANKIGYISRNC